MKYQQVRSLARRESILRSAIYLAQQPGGWARMTRQTIALNAGCSEGVINHYFGNMETLRKQVMRTAVSLELVEIVSQSLSLHDGFAVKRWLPASLKTKLHL